MLNFDISNPLFRQNFPSLLSSALFSSAGGFPKGLPYDINNLLDIQRKNVTAIAEAQGVILSGLRNMSRQQGDIMSAMIQNQSAFIRIFIQEGTPEGKIADAAELTKAQYKSTIENIRNIQDTLNETIRNAANILHQRTASNLSESQRQTVSKAIIPANSDDITQRKIIA